MTEHDPLTTFLAGLVVDMTWWLESAGETDIIDPDAAGTITESVGWELSNLPTGQRTRLLQLLDDMASAEEDEERRAVLRTFPSALGLVENDPVHPIASWGAWVHPARRPRPAP